MSLPAPGGSWLRLRVIGVALSAFGVALVAIGVVVGGFGSGSPATASSTSAVATETTTPASRSTTSSPPTAASVSSVVMTTTSEPSTTPVPTTAPVPPATIAPTATVDDSPSDVSVRVFNNSTIHGLSEKAAGELRAKGWNVVEVGNFTGRFPTTTVYYQPGTGEQAEATKLAASIGATTAPRIEEITSFAPGLIVVVTSDFSG